MAKYSLHGCDIELSDDGTHARVSRDGKLVDEFKCENVLDCMVAKVPIPQVQAHQCAKQTQLGKYTKPAKTPKDKEQ